MNLRSIAIACIALQLCACTTLNPVSVDRAALQNSLNVADKVVVRDTSGREQSVTLTSVSPQSICHSGGCIPAEEVATVARYEVSTGLTALLIVGIVMFIALRVALQSGAAGFAWQ